jgi:hypothetical protein
MRCACHATTPPPLATSLARVSDVCVHGALSKQQQWQSGTTTPCMPSVLGDRAERVVHAALATHMRAWCLLHHRLPPFTFMSLLPRPPVLLASPALAPPCRSSSSTVAPSWPRMSSCGVTHGMAATQRPLQPTHLQGTYARARVLPGAIGPKTQALIESRGSFLVHPRTLVRFGPGLTRSPGLAAHHSLFYFAACFALVLHLPSPRCLAATVGPCSTSKSTTFQMETGALEVKDSPTSGRGTPRAAVWGVLFMRGPSSATLPRHARMMFTTWTRWGQLLTLQPTWSRGKTAQRCAVPILRAVCTRTSMDRPQATTRRATSATCTQLPSICCLHLHLESLGSHGNVKKSWICPRVPRVLTTYGDASDGV